MATVTYTVVNGMVLSENRGGTIRDYVSDPLGSTVALLDGTQQQTDTFGYWPYGEVKTRTGTTPTPFQYVGSAGYYQDSGSQTYVRARYLQTVKGRWQTEDPIGFWGGDINLYRYVSNNPLGYTDSSGRLQQGIDYCGKNNKGLHGKPNLKPIGPCPDGGTATCVTCYGSNAKGGGHIGSPGPCGGDRRPRLGDCSIDTRPGHSQCKPGDVISFQDFGNGSTVGGMIGGQCRACDTGQGHTGVDIFVGGEDKDCDKALKNLGFPGGTGWYCIQCQPVIKTTYPTGDYPCYNLGPARKRTL